MSWILPDVRLPVGKVRTVRPLDTRESGAEIDEQPKTAAEQAPDRAPEPVTTPSPARPAAQPEHTDMAEKKPLAERIVEAFRKHGALTLEQLAKHAETSVATLYTMTSTLKKNGIAKLRQDGRASVYGFSGKDTPPQRKSTPAPAKPNPAAPKRINGSAPYAAALEGLRAKRSELAVEIEKLDRAIDAIGALTA